MADRESKTKAAASETGTKRTRPWLRGVGVVVVYLFAGAIINVLVAWGSALNATFPDDALFSSGSDSRSATSVEVTHLIQLGVAVEASSPVEVETVDSLGSTYREFWQRSGESIFVSTLLEDLRAGWPLKSMWCGRAGEQSWRAIQFQDTDVTGDERMVPLWPIGPAFIVNTLFYGAIAWVLFAAPFAMRRHRRAKRDRCPDCGYDLRGAEHGKCTECGKAVAGKRRQPNNPTAKQIAD